MDKDKLGKEMDAYKEKTDVFPHSEEKPFKPLSHIQVLDEQGCSRIVADYLNEREEMRKISRHGRQVFKKTNHSNER